MQINDIAPPLRGCLRALLGALNSLRYWLAKLRFFAWLTGRRQKPRGQTSQPNLGVTHHGEHIESDLFEGPKLKIARAKHHIADYRSAFATLRDLNIVRIEPEIDPETRNTVLKVRLAQPMPGDLRLTAADALYNLRSALDQAVCSCVRLVGESPKDTYFPHGSDKARFEVQLREKCKKVPEPVRHAIAALEPYHGGNGYLLRVLHDLNLVDKHRDLIAVGATLRKVSIIPGKGTLPKGEIWLRGEEKFEIAEAGFSPVDQNVKVTMAVSFTDVEAVDGESVTQVLNQACELASRTIAILEEAMTDYLFCAGLSARH